MIGDLKPYTKYKDSGHEWLGAIPEQWSILRAKFMFREVDDRSLEGKEELLSVSHLTGVTPRSQKTITMFLAESNVGHKVCQPFDLVINTMWAWMGALGVSSHHGIVSPAYGIYRPLAASPLTPSYASLLLRVPLYAAEYQRRSTGVNSSRLRLYPEQFLRMPIIVPTPDDQASIVRFLEWSNLRLDKAIRAKRKVIALLNEQKRAVIQRALRCGLDPSVSFKPSGVSWLGAIPQHWKITRVKNEFVCLNTRRVPLNSVERGAMNSRTYPYYGASGIIDLVNDYLFDEELLLIAEDGANLVLRNLPLAIIARGKFWVNNHAHILKPKNGNIVYLAHLLETLNYMPWISGAAQPKLTQDRLLAITLAVAPPNEQEAIVSHISRQTRPLDTAISRLQREVELLREYRTRLIADAVTGKIDVRDMTISNADDVATDVREDDLDLMIDPEAADEELAV